MRVVINLPTISPNTANLFFEALVKFVNSWGIDYIHAEQHQGGAMKVVINFSVISPDTANLLFEALTKFIKSWGIDYKIERD